MDLVDSYKIVKKSIVFFSPKYIPIYNENNPKPLYSQIIGTGFVIDADGLIVTNDHVVEAFSKVYRPPGTREDDWAVKATLYCFTEIGLLEIQFEIIGVMRIDDYKPGEVYYGPPKPDVGIVQVKAKGLPALALYEGEMLQEGMEVATAGFPMGTDALTAPGWLHQITPTLQQGIISAILPFTCPTPHGFSINIMTQGGASGSPVFLPYNAGVIGVLYAGLNDIGVTRLSKDIYTVPSNISYVVPFTFIIKSLNLLRQHMPDELLLPSDTLSLQEMLDTYKIIDTNKVGRHYEIKRIE